MSENNSNGNNGNGQALARRDERQQNPLMLYLKPREKTLAQYVAGRLKPEVLIRLALLEFSQNEWLRKCTPETIYASLITAAQLGLEPGAAKGEAYLVPYQGRCQLIPGYRGLIKLALRSGVVKQFYSHLAYQGDDFSIELGSEPRVVHRPSLSGGRDEEDLIGAYAIAKFDDGSFDVEWMDFATLTKVRRASKSGANGPYKEWSEEMYRKAPIRRLSKRLPLGDDFFKANAIDQAVESGGEMPKLDNDAIDAEVVVEEGGKPSTGSKLGDKVRDAAER